MTLPRERNNAIRRTYAFLTDLLSRDLTPRVPMKVRERAMRCLRHYPTPFDLDLFEIGTDEILERKEKKK